MPDNILNPNPSPAQIRAELEQMVIHELLGPAHGEHEELDERSVRDRYILDRLTFAVEGVAAALNHARYEAEVKAGLHSKKGGRMKVEGEKARGARARGRRGAKQAG